MKQGELSVDDYEVNFLSLSHFIDNMFQAEERKARMFERGLRPLIPQFVVLQRPHTLVEAADSARVLEIDHATSQRSRDATTRATTQATEKGKGKRPLADFAPPQ